MKNLSYWARDHKWPARIIIVASFFFLTVLGFITGILLDELGISISAAAMLLFACAYLTAFILYPSKSQKNNSRDAGLFYPKQKSCDLILAASTFCMIISIGNNPDAYLNSGNPVFASSIPKPLVLKDSTDRIYQSVMEFSASMKDHDGKALKWKERKKLLKQQLKAITNANDLTPGQKTLLVILSVLIALFLLGLVGALACNLSCSGAEGAAALVAIGGTAVVIILFLVVIRAIYGKKKRKIRKETTTAG